jgi:hypothetical protein
MPSFGAESKRHLATLDPQLQRLMNEAIKHIDFSITCGYRGKEDQDKAYREGKSKVQWPNGKHNTNPSKAVDIAPYPIDWSDAEAFTYLAGIIKGISLMMNIPIICGIDWDNDGATNDHKFKDRPHVQLRD